MTHPHQHTPPDDAPASAVRRATSRGHGDARLASLPFAASISLHILLVAVGGALVWSVTRQDPPPPTVADVSFLDPTLGEPDNRELAEQPDDRSLAEAILPPHVDALDADSTLPPPPTAQPAADAPPPPRAPQLAAADVLPPDADLRTARARNEVTFAGATGGDARDIVYVVDASGSMLATLPIVKAELKRSLAQLDPTQRFQVVFFQAGGFTSSANATGIDGLARASRRNLDAAYDWIGDAATGITARGFSNPIPALRHALALAPDAVFVLSSAVQAAGQWDPDDADILDELDRLNPPDPTNGARPVTIKAIQYLKPDRDRLLWNIARQHGGGDDAYTWFSRQDLEQLRDELR